MKKLLVAAVAAVMTTGAFADHHGTKHMVKFAGFSDAGVSETFDVSTSSDDADNKSQNIALNYAYAINNNWQVGLTYKTYTSEDGTNENASNTLGFSGYYNMGEKLTSTCYVALHLNTTNVTDGSVNGMDEDDSKVDTVLEYGHRFEIGHAWGMHLTYAPSLAYTMSKTTDDSADEDVNATSLAWNWIKFDVLF